MAKREDGLPRTAGGTSGMQGTNLSGHGIQSETPIGPYRRCCSEIFRNNEKAAQEPTSSCRATRRAKGTDLSKLWIPEEVGCHLQEGVLPCKIAWHKMNIVRDKWTRAKAVGEIRTVWTLRARVWMHHEGRKGLKNLGSGWPQYLKKQDLQKLLWESMRNVNEILRRTTVLEIAKRIARSTVGLRTIKDGILWRDRPLRNGKHEQWEGRCAETKRYPRKNRRR
jgi:hypothetical protein